MWHENSTHKKKKKNLDSLCKNHKLTCWATLPTSPLLWCFKNEINVFLTQRKPFSTSSCIRRKSSLLQYSSRFSLMWHHGPKSWFDVWTIKPKFLLQLFNGSDLEWHQKFKLLVQISDAKMPEIITSIELKFYVYKWRPESRLFL